MFFPAPPDDKDKVAMWIFSFLSLDELLVLTGALLLRCLLASHPHSGQSVPPMFGDYEAQRHWQEITVNLPASDWYRNTSDNDLLYWGLDYPPLTAYHSLVLGHVAREMIDPAFVELGASRGMESPAHKIFMRTTVLVSDLLVFLPAALFFARSVHPPAADKDTALAFALVALYPGLILIDNGHFQYNDISLGLFALAVAFVARGRDIWASVCFVLALNYKQMELYHALPFFFYLLGKCYRQDSYVASARKLLFLGLTVLATFALVWLPFLGDLDSVTQVLRRIFPLDRGVFEDKVSNVWCTLNLVVKLKEIVDPSSMALVCMASTLLASLPANLMLMCRPNLESFLLALINTSLAFFLLSFQVHEKSILLVAVPAALYAASNQVKHGRYSSIVSCWLLVISTLSMFPLLLKDGLALPSVMLTVFYFIGCNNTGFLSPVKLIEARSPRPRRVQPIGRPMWMDEWVKFGTLLSLAVGLGLVLGSVTISPPANLPDLWAVVVSAYSCIHFVAFALYFNCLQFSVMTDGTRDKKKLN